MITLLLLMGRSMVSTKTAVHTSIDLILSEPQTWLLRLPAFRGLQQDSPSTRRGTTSSQLIKEASIGFLLGMR